MHWCMFTGVKVELRSQWWSHIRVTFKCLSKQVTPLNMWIKLFEVVNQIFNSKKTVIGSFNSKWTVIGSFNPKWTVIGSFKNSNSKWFFKSYF